MKHLETVWIEDFDKEWGNVYDKPYYTQTGIPRRIIGRWQIVSRWMQGPTPMASFWVELGLHNPTIGFGRRRIDREGCMNVWSRS